MHATGHSTIGRQVFPVLPNCRAVKSVSGAAAAWLRVTERSVRRGDAQPAAGREDAKAVRKAFVHAAVAGGFAAGD
jgi:hypothetical protein